LRDDDCKIEKLCGELEALGASVEVTDLEPRRPIYLEPEE
jgi:hypothetical protein